MREKTGHQDLYDAGWDNYVEAPRTEFGGPESGTDHLLFSIGHPADAANDEYHYTRPQGLIDENEEAEIDPNSLKMEDYVTDLRKYEPETKFLDLHKGFCEWFIQYTIQRKSRAYVCWLNLVSMAFIYNALAVPLRATFPYQTSENVFYWFIFDYLSDLIYLLDMLAVKPKLTFMSGGLEIQNPKRSVKNYTLSSTFYLDLLAILPFDALYLIPALRFNCLLRFNRSLKYRSWSELQTYFENITASAYILRVLKTFTNMLYMIHLNACAFYYISSVQWPAPDNPWIYNGEGNAYIRCFYFATKLAISIGNNPFPTNILEHIYATVAWMLGVFVIAILLGNIQEIIGNATKTKENYSKSMDSVLQQLKKLSVSDAIVEKARMWFVHTWEQQRTLNESQLIESLPRKLQTDLAISVHYKTLGKIKLFQGFDIALIRELVLKLRPVLFLPGDYICRKNEVGKEMYIVSSGNVQVVGGPDGNTVFVTLRSGSIFGEVSLMAKTGKNRRTSDVKSKGYAFLFILSREDLDDTIKDYPQSFELFKQRARRLMKVYEKREEQTKTKPKKNPELEKPEAKPSQYRMSPSNINVSGWIKT